MTQCTKGATESTVGKKYKLFMHLCNHDMYRRNCKYWAVRLRVVRPYGGFINDIKNRYPHYLSDITEALTMQCLASIFFIFFAVISPVVTFGGVLGQKTEGYLVSVPFSTLLLSYTTSVKRPFFPGQPGYAGTGKVILWLPFIQKPKDDDLSRFKSHKWRDTAQQTLILLQGST